MSNRKDKSDALIGELESIRALLNEDEQHANVPLLIPENSPLAIDRIPVLSVVAADVQKPTTEDSLKKKPTEKILRKETATTPETETSKSGDRVTQQNHLPATLPTVITSSVSQREKLVDDIVRSALPRLESLLRELVQEALLQDKLRGGKR